MTKYKNVYAEKFFGRVKSPKAFGGGFVGIVREGYAEKPTKLFSSMCDMGVGKCKK